MSDYSDPARVRDIIAALRHGGEPVTLDTIEAQFHFETGHLLPAVWRASPPSWLRAATSSASQPSVGGGD